MWRVSGTVAMAGTAVVAERAPAYADGLGEGLATDLAAEEVVHGRLRCEWVRLGLQVGHGYQLAVGVLGAEGGRPVARQRPAVPQSSVAHPGRSSINPRP